MQKKFIFLYCFWLMLTGVIFAQDVQDIEPGTYYISDIKVMGTDRYSKNQIVRFTGIYPGDSIKIPGNDINTAIKKLWKTNRFSDVVIYAMNANNKRVELGIELQLTPQIGSINFTGIPKGKADKFKKDYKIEVGDRFTEAYRNKISNEIKNFYKEKGFADVKVIFKEKEDESGLKEDLNIDVQKGKKIKVAKINIEGNKKFSDRRLRSKLKNTKQRNVFRVWKASKYDDSKFEEDIKNLNDYMQSEGFRDSKVKDYTVSRDADNQYVINIEVEEGNKYYLGEVEYVGNSVYPTELLSKIFGYQKGDAFDAVGINKKIAGSMKDDDILTLYQDNGYLFSNARMIEKSVHNDTIDVEVRIREGEQAYWDKVTFEGNLKTHDHVVQRSLRTLPGELFSKSQFKRTYFELGGMGFFDPQSISYDMEQHPETNTVDINWKLAEKDASQVQVQGGYGGGTFIGTVGLQFNNFSLGNLFKGKWNGVVPQGDGQTLGINAQAGRNYQNYSLTFTEPWLTGKKPTSLSVSLYATLLKGSYGPNSKLNILGASISSNKSLNWPDDYFRLSQGLSFQNYQFTNYAFNFGQERVDTGSSNNFAYFASFGRYSSGPNPIFPTSGAEFELGLKLTPPYSLFGNKDYANLEVQEKYKFLEYYKIKTKLYWYKELIGKLVLKSGGEFGFLSYYNREVGVPPFERFYIGGTGLNGNRFDGREIIPLRGYQDSTSFGGEPGRDITPAGGGSVYNKFLFELRYPITTGQTATIYGLTFAAAGNAWDGFTNYRPFELKRSAGVGVRIFMPQFGLLGFDFGYGFDNPLFSDKPSGFQTHFIFGQNL